MIAVADYMVKALGALIGVLFIAWLVEKARESWRER